VEGRGEAIEQVGTPNAWFALSVVRERAVLVGARIHSREGCRLPRARRRGGVLKMDPRSGRINNNDNDNNNNNFETANEPMRTARPSRSSL